MKARIALALLAILFAVTAIEAGLWALGLPRPFDEFSFLGEALAQQDTFEPDPELFWRVKSTATHVEANAFGLRGNWVNDHKAPNEFRIACVGDSCTFGIGVRYDQTYGVCVERALQSKWPDRQVSTVLLGVPGYSTHQQRKLCEMWHPRLRPDLTLLYVGAWNDFTPAIGMTDRDQDQARRQPRLVQLANRAFGPDRSALAEEQKSIFVNGGAPSQRRVSIAEFEENVAAMIEIAGSHGSEVLVVIPTWPAKTIEDFPIVLEYASALRSTCDTHGVPTIEANELFATHERWFVDWVHPSSAGHARLADAIVARWSPRFESTTPARVSARALEPNTVDALQDELFRTPTTATRLHIGDRSAFRVTASNAWRLRGLLTPGTHSVRWVDEHGLTVSQQPLHVRPVSVRAELGVGEQANERRLTIEVDATAGAGVAAWFSTRERENPQPTQYGPFLLGTASTESLAQDFSFEDIALPVLAARADETGLGRIEHVLEVRPHQIGNPVWVQVLVRDDETLTGSLSATVRIVP